MALTTQRLIAARETVSSLLDQLGLTNYRYDVEPSGAGWQVQLECRLEQAWRTFRLELTDAALDESASKARLLGEWRALLGRQGTAPRSVSLVDLVHSAPIEAVEVHGRVVLHEPHGFRVSLDGVVAHARGDTRPPLGAWIRLRGRWNGEQLQAIETSVLATSRRDLARADSDFSWGQLGGIESLRGRHRMLRVARGFFEDAGFTEVETPAVVRSPSLELHVDAPEVLGADGPRWLQTSPEHHMKRLLSAGMSRIYQVCKAYRRGESGTQHQPEFTLLEWYRAFAGSGEVMADTERLVTEVARRLCGTTRIPGIEAPVDVTPPWDRLTMREAFERYASTDLDRLLPDQTAFYRVFVERVAPKLGRGRPVFLTHFPATFASLSRLTPGDPTTADRFEAYVDGVELCDGFGELTDPSEQRARFEADLAARRAAGRPVYPIDDRFLDALEDALPPSSGNALGVDRLAMLVLGKRNIGQVIAFSAARG